MDCPTRQESEEILMPYISDEEKKRIVYSQITPGQLNYLYTQAIIKAWVRAPCYATIAALAKDVGRPSCEFQTPELVALTQRPHPVTVDTLSEQTALFLAFLEFYRRVGQHYENFKMIHNGDVYYGVPFVDGKEP